MALGYPLKEMENTRNKYGNEGEEEYGEDDEEGFDYFN